MDIASFEILRSKIEKELIFDEKKAEIQCVNVPGLYQRYLDVYIKELRILKVMSADLDKKYGELYKHIKYHDNYQWGAKGEIDGQINSNIEYHKMRIELAQQENIVKYLEEVLDNIKRLSYTIKNWIEIKKFMAGMY